jgi:predicted RNase H-like HicB family nuclease
MDEILFLIEQDPEGGFNAQAIGHSIFTQGDTEEELKINILDAIKCHFEKKEDLPKIVRLHFVRDEVLSGA